MFGQKKDVSHFLEFDRWLIYDKTMNENNNKLMQLIYALMTTNDYMNIEQMSKAISMSQRTINNYLKQIRTDEELSNIFILKKSAYGIKLNVVNSEEYENLRDKLELSLFHTKSGNRKSSNAIVIELLLYLLDADDYTKIRDLADRFYYSVGSVNKYLKDIKIILQAYRLDLDDKPYHGIRISGDEVMIRHLYGDLIEYTHNNEGITNETTNYSKYYSTSNDDRNKLKTEVIETVIAYAPPINNALLKTIYKYIELSHARFMAGYHVTLNDEEKSFVRRFREFKLAEQLLKRVYPEDGILKDENETYCLARRIIVGFGSEISVEKCPEAGEEQIGKAENLAQITVNYLSENEIITFSDRAQSIRRYLTNLYLSLLISEELSDSLSMLCILLKEDVVIKGQLSYTLAYKIGRHLENTGKLHLTDKAIVMLSVALHYAFIIAPSEPRKMNVIISTEYLPEENESIKYRLMRKDLYECISRIDIQYLYGVSQTYHDYDIAIFDFPSAYIKNYPLKCIPLSDMYNSDDIERVYKEILNYAMDFRSLLESHGLRRINLYDVSVTGPNLIKRLFARHMTDQTEIVSNLVNEVTAQHMLIQNGVVIVMNKTDDLNSFDIYRTPAMIVKDSKTYVDTVCFVNYCFDDSQVFVKVMELLAYDITALIEFIERSKKAFIETDEIAEYINRLYVY